jgi:hypothetical protein
LAVNEIARILLGRKPHHDAKAVLLSDVKKLSARCRMGNTYGVKSVRGHQSKISIENLEVLVFLTAWTWSESPVRNTPDPKLSVAHEQKFTSGVRPLDLIRDWSEQRRGVVNPTRNSLESTEQFLGVYKRRTLSHNPPPTIQPRPT